MVLFVVLGILAIMIISIVACLLICLLPCLFAYLLVVAMAGGALALADAYGDS